MKREDAYASRATRLMEGTTPESIIRWAAEEFGDSCVALVSLQNPILPHLVVSNAPSIPLAFIDTTYHFDSTWEYKRALEERLGVAIQIIRTRAARDDRWRTDTGKCCEARKVEPLQEHLAPYRAFISGVRRADHIGRSRAQVVSWDTKFTRYRIQPLVSQSDDDQRSYIGRFSLPDHPLTKCGYPSVGCWPCTTAVVSGEDTRAGRWRDQAHSECGINSLYEDHGDLYDYHWEDDLTFDAEIHGRESGGP